MRWWVVGAWVGTALLATVALGSFAVFAGPLPEVGHWIGHLVLCGGAALLIGRAAPRREGLAFAGAVLFGLAIEIVQSPLRPPITDVLFDLGTDTVGAAVGLILGSRRRAEVVGHLLSAVLHPLWVAPVGFAAALYAEHRSVGYAAGWTGLAAVSVLPAVAWWVAGIRRRWWTDADVSRRTDRPVLLALGCLGLVALSGLAWSGPWDLAVRMLLASAIGAALTVAGCKVSGHVAIPALLGLAIVRAGSDAWFPVVGIAVVLSWARIAAGRHRPIEVAAAWALAML